MVTRLPNGPSRRRAGHGHEMTTDVGEGARKTDFVVRKRMAEPAVIVEKDGHVLIVTLNRPEKRNAVNCEVMCRLYDAWNELDRDDELRVAILTGKGPTFCAGMDLSEIGKLSAGKAENEWMEMRLRSARDIDRTRRATPRPIRRW